MRLSTIRTRDGTAVARDDGGELVVIPGTNDLRTFLEDSGWQQRAARATGQRAPYSGHRTESSGAFEGADAK